MSKRELDCEAIEPLLAPYGEPDCGPVLTAAERDLVSAHLERCPACRQTAQACASACAAVRANAAALTEHAPPSLRARCLATADRHGAPRRATRWLGWTAVGAVAAALLFVVLMPAQAIATQLTVDHVTCAKFGPGRTQTRTPAELERLWRDTRREEVAIPAGSAADGLRLTGLRRCFSVRGGVAHVMYDQGGAPVSLFILRGAGAGGTAASRELEAVGHKAILWTSGSNTYMLIGRRGDLATTALHMQEEISERADQR